MTNFGKVLTVLLIAQLGLAAFFNIGTDKLATFDSGAKLFELGSADLTEIVIGQKEQSDLTLKKQGDKWVLPGHFGFTADKRKLENITRELLALKRSWPVATTEIAAKKFNLLADTSDRKIVVSAGDKKETLLIGSSPAFRRFHVRRPEEKEIYAVELEAHQLSAKASDWFDKSLLIIDRENIRSLSLNDFKLVAGQEGEFVVEGLKEGLSSKQKEVGDVIDKIAKMSFSDVLGQESKDEYRLSEPALTVTLETKDNEVVKYAFGFPVEQSYAVLKSSKFETYFKVQKGIVENLKKMKREELFEEKSVEAESKDASEADPGKAVASEEIAEKANPAGLDSDRATGEEIEPVDSVSSNSSMEHQHSAE